MIKESLKEFKFWEVKAKIDSHKSKTSIILAEDGMNAISDMMENMEKEGHNRQDLWQYSYAASQV